MGVGVIAQAVWRTSSSHPNARIDLQILDELLLPRPPLVHLSLAAFFPCRSLILRPDVPAVAVEEARLELGVRVEDDLGIELAKRTVSDFGVDEAEDAMVRSAKEML
jgi:hypothetical protein